MVTLYLALKVIYRFLNRDPYFLTQEIIRGQKSSRLKIF